MNFLVRKLFLLFFSFYSFAVLASDVIRFNIIAPPKVTGLEVINYYDDLVDIQWDLVADSSSYRLDIAEGFENNSYTITENTATLNIYNYQDKRVKVTACNLDVCGESSVWLTLSRELIQRPTDFHYLVSDDYQTITIKWLNNANALFYKVFKANEDGQYSFHSNVSTNEFTESDVSYGDSFNYYVLSCKNGDECSQAGYYHIGISEVNFILSKPEIEVVAQANQVRISISDSEHGFESIKLYRRSERFGTAQLITEQEFGLNRGTFDFFDNVTADQHYFYYAQVCINQQCLLSDDIEFKGLDSYTAEMSVISDLTASQNTHQDHIELNWSISSQVSFQALYKRDLRNNSFSLLTNPRLSGDVRSYQDFDVIPGQKYQYKIVPYINELELPGIESNIAEGGVFYQQGDLWQPEAPILTTTPYRYTNKIEFFWSRTQNNIEYRNLFVASSELGEYTLLSRESKINDNKFTISNLQVGEARYIKIQACTTYICSELSEPLFTSTTLNNDVPLTPSAPSLELVRGSQVNITITPVINASYYKIHISDSLDNNGFTHAIETSAQNLSVTFNRIWPATYYYSIIACSATGCSEKGDYAEITTQSPEFDLSDVSQYYIESASLSHPELVQLLISKKTDGSHGPRLNIYSSDTVDGVKTFLVTKNDWFQGYVNIEDLELDRKYYFWLENCYQGDICQMEPYYQVGMRKSVETAIPKIPTSFTVSQGEHINYVKGKVDRLINGTSIEVYEQNPDTLELTHKVTYPTYGNGIMVNSEPYGYTPLHYVARSCYQGNCSDYTNAVMGWPAELHTNAVQSDSTLWSNGWGLWNVGGQQGSKVGGSPVSQQNLFHANGYQLSLNLYVSSGSRSVYGVNCIMPLSIDWENPNSITSGGRKYNRDVIINIIRNDNGCEHDNFIEDGAYYLLPNGDYDQAIKIDIPEDEWFTFGLDVDAEGNAKVSLNSALSIETQIKASELFPEFGHLSLSSNIVANPTTYYNSWQYNSLTDFSRSRPLSTHIGIQNVTNSLSVDVYNRNLADAALTTQVSIFQAIRNQGNGHYYIFEFIDEVSFAADTDTSIAHTLALPEISADYIIASKRCEQQTCSAHELSFLEAKVNYLVRPSVNVSQSDNLYQLDVSWNQKNNANFYKVYASTSKIPFESTYIDKTTALSMSLENLSSKKWYIWVKACDTEIICSDFSEINSYGIRPKADDDNDGVLNDDDAFPLDPSETEDTDGDGVGDNADVFPFDGSESVDTDGDGIGNNADNDDDGDGIIDEEDSAPLDSTVGDEEPPVFHSLDDITLEATGINTPVELIVPNVTDNNLNAPTVAPNYESLPLGLHEITWTAIDFVGNVSTALQLVNIVDTTAPMFNDVSVQTIDARGLLTNISSDVSIQAYDIVDGDVTATILANTSLLSGKHVITVSAQDMSGNRSETDVVIYINPQVELNLNAKVEAGSNVHVPIYLSGEAAVYPVSVNYQVQGVDANIESVELLITEGVSGSLKIIVPSDAVASETIHISLVSVNNALLGSLTTSILTIDEDNHSPIVQLRVEQNTVPVSVIDSQGGMVTITAMINDFNTSDTHDIVWTSSLIDSALDSEITTFEFLPETLTSGTYGLSVGITENNTSELYSVAIKASLIVDAQLAELSGDEDSDNDGIPDAEEGYADSDQDGIADYLDGDDNPSHLPISDAIAPMQTTNGLSLSLGDVVGSSNGIEAQNASIDINDITENGGVNGAPVDNALDSDFEALSTIINFNVSGLLEIGDIVPVVIPLAEGKSVPQGAVYRKYNAVTGWFDFVIDNDNKIFSSIKSRDGNCPAPLSIEYVEGLNVGDNCIQLLIKDGGDNDGDGLANGMIKDPGVLVTEVPNNVPSVSINSHYSSYNEGASVSLTAQGVDSDGDNLTYSWDQVSGTTVSLSDTSSATLMFTAPQVSSDNMVEFKVTVFDGIDSVSVITSFVIINVVAVTPPPKESSEGGSGGSISWLLILFGFASLGGRMNR